VSSLIAGVVAIVERPYRPGDWVKIDGDYGEVRSVGMRSIELRTAADNIVYVPHEKIWGDRAIQLETHHDEALFLSSIHCGCVADAWGTSEACRSRHS
jgi:hypothetical protein